MSPANIETLEKTHSAPGVKQQLAAVRMLFKLYDRTKERLTQDEIERIVI
jgi:hypothetical protein